MNNKKQSKGKFKGKNQNFKMKDSKFQEVLEHNQTYNEFGWYNRNPELLRDAATLPYSNVLGLPVKIGSTDTYLPGAMVIRYAMGVGLSVDDASDANVLASLLYAKNRRANSGAKTYEPADLMINYLAIGSAYVFYSELARVYGILNTYSKRNRYIARGLITALGYNYDNLLSNMAQLRAYVNQFAIRINSYAVPKLAYFDRQIKLAGGYFKDANHDKAQLYLTQCDTIYKFMPAASETGGLLQPVNFPQSNMTLDTVMSIGNEILAALEYNDDVGIMTGDTLKSYGEEGVYHVKGIDLEFALTPIYDEAMLAQIHHARPQGTMTKTGWGAEAHRWEYQGIWQENGRIRYNPWFEPGPLGTHVISIRNPLLDCGYNEPTVEYNTEATRLMSIATSTVESVTVAPSVSITGHRIEACGSEIVTTIQMVKFDAESDIELTTIGDIKASTSGTSVTGQLYATLEKQCFDWSPILYVISGSEIIVNGEVFNYTAISTNTLKYIHNACLLSLFDIGSFNI